MILFLNYVYVCVSVGACECPPRLDKSFGALGAVCRPPHVPGFQFEYAARAVPAPAAGPALRPDNIDTHPFLFFFFPCRIGCKQRLHSCFPDPSNHTETMLITILFGQCLRRIPNT